MPVATFNPWDSEEEDRVLSYDPLIPPLLLRSEILAPDIANRTVLQGRRDAISIITQESDRLLVLCGPCSIHSPDSALEYAAKLKQLSKKFSNDLCIIMRANLENSPGIVGWKGIINDPDMDENFRINKGLRIARQLFVDITISGVPIVTEMLDTISPQFLSDLLSLGVVGPHRVESQLHRELASGAAFPVGFENGSDDGLAVAIDAVQAAAEKHHFIGVTKQGIAAIARTEGNGHGFVVLGGGAIGEESVRATKEALRKRNRREIMMIDCWHGDSHNGHADQLLVAKTAADQVRAGEDGIVGVIMESNVHGGYRDFTANMSAELDTRVSVSRTCMDWDTTVCVLEDLTAAVRERRLRRSVAPGADSLRALASAE